MSLIETIGSYGDRLVKITVVGQPRPSAVVCLFHGVYGAASERDGDKYWVLGEKLSALGLSACLVETSRMRRDKWTFSDPQTWAQAAFSGKTYRQELYDQMSGLSEVGRAFPGIPLCLWGFSLGGINSLIIAGGQANSLVSEEGYEPPETGSIAGVVVSGSGDTLKSDSSFHMSLPIIDSICAQETLHSACRSIDRGWVRFFWGDMDDTFNRESSYRLFDLVTTEDKAFHVVSGADHSFRKRWGVPSSEPLDCMLDELKDHIQGQPGV